MLTEKSSKNVESVLIDGFTYQTGKGMTVTLKNGNTYHYPNATSKHFADMLAAESKGSHFAKVISKMPSIRIK